MAPGSSGLMAFFDSRTPSSILGALAAAGTRGGEGLPRCASWRAPQRNACNSMRTW
jgi:hypothetical protein